VSRCGTGGSLQAVYHDLRKLIREGIIIKLGDRYIVRMAWLLSTHLIFQTAFNDYVKARDRGLLVNNLGKRSLLRVGSLSELLRLWSGITMGLMVQGGVTEYFEWSPHAWFGLCSDLTEQQILEAHSSMGLPYHLVIGNDTPLSRLYTEMRKGVPGMVRFAEASLPELQSKHVSVFSTFVITIQLPQALVAELDSVFDPKKFPVSKEAARALLAGAHQIEVRVENDSSKAEQLSHRLRSLLGISAPIGPHVGTLPKKIASAA